MLCERPKGASETSCEMMPSNQNSHCPNIGPLQSRKKWGHVPPPPPSSTNGGMCPPSRGSSRWFVLFQNHQNPPVPPPQIWRWPQSTDISGAGIPPRRVWHERASPVMSSRFFFGTDLSLVRGPRHLIVLWNGPISLS